MATEYFILGFAAALGLVFVLVVGTYYYLKHTRGNPAEIKGYLDLMDDLTEEQRQKLQDIRHTFLPKVERIRESLCRKRLSLAGTLFSEPEDREGVHSVAQDILRCQAELEHEVIEHILEEKEILNNKQREKFHRIILDQFAHGGLGVHDIKQRRAV